MSSSKRRADAPTERRPEKKQKSEKSKHQDKTRPAQSHSVLRDEETAFPRGGVNVLTPLEKRQIQIQAKQDVLFEQSTGQKASADYDSDVENEGGDLAEAKPQANAKVAKKDKKTKRKDKKDKGGKASAEDSGPKIESLGYKRLVPGSIILGQVASINRYDVTVTLPNSLVGYLPLTEISEELTQAVETLATKEEDDDSSDADESEIDNIRLQDFLKVGQYLRVLVTKIGGDEGGQKEKSRRHISLSSVPAQVNNDLSKPDLVTGNVVQASVKSVEDHGVIMNVGTEGGKIQGFLPKKDLPANVKHTDLKAGAVMLCLVLGMNPNGTTVKLSASLEKIANIQKDACLTDAPSVDTFLPGCAVDILVTDVSEAGLVGKVMGLLDVTADWIHSGRDLQQKPLIKRHPVGSHVKARVICTFPTSETKKLGISLLPHILSLASQKPKTTDDAPLQLLPISSIVESAKIVNVESSKGVVLELGIKGVPGFAHISRLSDEKTNSITADSGPYKIGTIHRARVVGYNSLDGQFTVSLQKSTLDAAFLRMEDVPIGAVIKATVSRVVQTKTGKHFIELEIANDIKGSVSELHISDVFLHNPEKKFRAGAKVSTRVLNVDLEQRRITLTCKKSLVNNDAPVWKTYADPKPREQSPGTIVSITSSGAVVTYFGAVRAFLPVGHMSESFVKDPRKHFQVGQVVSTHPISIDADNEKMTVSCRDPSAFGPQHQKAFDELNVGSLVSGTVTEKLQDKLVVQIPESGLNGNLPVDHLADGSANKCANAAKMIRVGQTLKNLLVLQKNTSSQTLQLSNKPSLLKAAQADRFPSRIEDVNVGGEVVGFVSNITATGVFVKFGAGLTALLPANGIPDSTVKLPNFGLGDCATVTAKVSHIDKAKDRFSLTQKELVLANADGKKSAKNNVAQSKPLSNPVDGTSQTTSDYDVGTKTKARIESIKDTQLNVILADGIHGRIDVSQVFDSWEDIKDHKNPLASFHVGQVLPVLVLGQRDHRNHRFLPISHTGKAQVFELSAKPSDLAAKQFKVLGMEDILQGKEYVCFVNNVVDQIMWVNITPNIRGRIHAMEASDNVSLLSNLEANFPDGSALRARVVSIDAAKSHLDLSARSGSHEPKNISDLTEGNVLPAKVTRIFEQHIVVALGKSISGPVRLVELADDYSKADPTDYKKDQVVRVHITKIDLPNKKLTLSTRPSKTLSSTLPVTDRDYQEVSELHVNDIVRGFIKNINDGGIYVSLSTNVTAFVPVRELSDNFVADWQSQYQRDELVKGRVMNLDAERGRVQLSCKSSVLSGDYKAPLSWYDLKPGMIVTGKVRKVEDYGVFIVVDNSADKVSGLCHKTQMAEERVPDVKSLYSVGDHVKAKVLKVDLSKQRRELAFSLKASHFKDADEMDIDGDDDDGEENDIAGGVDLSAEELDQDTTDDSYDENDIDSDLGDADDLDGDDSDEGVDITASIRSIANAPGAAISQLPSATGLNIGNPSSGGLNVGGFDWSGKRQQQDEADTEDESASDDEPQKKKRRKPLIHVDQTAELDINGPQSSDDFERLLMTEPNSSTLWVPYIAHYLGLNDITKARETAERAVNMVNHQRKDTEEDALNIWIAYLNLENTYGSDETLEAVFTRAKQYNDSKEIHNRLASIHIQSGKTEQADALFQTMLKKFGSDPAIWLNYATFLFDTMNKPVQGRDLLVRALQALPDNHLDTTIKFAQLEFKSANGDTEQGRTRFERLIDTYPKRTDLFNVYLDLEIKVGDKDTIRRLFQRASGNSKLKPKQAKYFFKRWEEWEEQNGDAKGIERVIARASEWVRKHEEDKQTK